MKKTILPKQKNYFKILGAALLAFILRRMACIYIQALEEYALGKKEAFLVFGYGSASVVEYALIARNLYNALISK